MELRIDRVSKQFKNKRAVDRVSLQMGTGVYGLLGANGAGKTTLMRMMAGILRPDGGDIWLDGINVAQEEYRDTLGYLPQSFGYYPNFTAKEFLMYLASLKGLAKAKAKARTEELLELVNLTHEAKKKIKTFSGGMKQRLGIAQALLNNPKILILDEPTAGLDPKERVKFRNMISRLGSERIVLLSTHIVSDVEYIADEIFVMKDGVILHQGTGPEILSVLEGKVYECRIPEEFMNEIIANYKVINIREEQGEVFLRLVGEKPPAKGASVVPATLEDLYLYYFSDKGELL